ncbi:ROK family protein [Rhodococcoides fascians]|uniref:ROK family protein n=1 Tax=Rhodococcoides fascians TaxID=1828 RepID=UPI000A68547A|nr:MULTISPECIES: ROK family protein [Rhodococcus]
MAPTSDTSARARWLGAAQLTAVVRANPGITRVEAAQRLGIGSGGATELVARLKHARILDETPAKTRGRGRPTTVLGPHPQGPLVLAAELRSSDWRLAVSDIFGNPVIVSRAPRSRPDPDEVLAGMAEEIERVHLESNGRVRAVSLSVAGTVSDNTLVQFTPRGWTDADLTPMTAGLPSDVAFLVGNDATLAGLAEARTGAARGASTALHLIIAVGVGGTLVVDGTPTTGARGAAGEYGHIPFGDPAVRCPCGARGCWDLSIDGRALATSIGDAPPADPVGYARDLVARLDAGDNGLAHAFDSVAESLGRGIAGLVNLHDPEVVTLGGLAPALRGAAQDCFRRAYVAGLMSFRKAAPPEVLDGVHGDDGPLYGAVHRGVDHITTDISLAEWSTLGPG